MKAVKYFVMGALMIGFSGSVKAQDGTSADVNAVKNIISSKPADLDKQMKPFYKKNKKNGENLVAFGRAFLEAKDTANAAACARMALETVKNKMYAPAFLLLGDVASAGDDGGKAAEYYDQAIYADPKNPDAYYRYALVYRKISPAGAVEKLRELKTQRPDIEVDEMIGRIYSLSLKYEDAIKAWNNVPIEKMDRANIVEYAVANYFLGRHQDGLDVAKKGLAVHPRAAALNRIAMMTSSELKNFEEAEKFGHNLFNNSDSAKISSVDYYYFGIVYDGLKMYDKAIEQYLQALSTTDESSLIKRENILKKLSDTYSEKQDFVNAIIRYKDYLGAVAKPSANDYAALGSLHMQHGASLTGDAKTEAFKKADAAYADLAQRFEDAADYATLMRARANVQLDPETKEGLALPYYEKLIELISPKSDYSASDKARLIESYRYMIAYYYITKDDKDKATEFAQKLIAIDPENAIAKQLLGM